MTNTEYMSYRPRVERVVQRLMNTTLKDLKGSWAKESQTKKSFKFLADTFIPVEQLSKKRFEDMTYIELVCLINNIGNNPRYDSCPYRGRMSEQMSCYICILDILLESGKVFIPARMFTALPIGAFYYYLDSVSADQAENLRDVFQKDIRACCKYKEGLTIKEFLLEKAHTLNRSWKPGEKVQTYIRKIIDAHRDIGKVLVDSFYTAFPEQFHAEIVCNKYRISEKEKAEKRKAWEEIGWEEEDDPEMEINDTAGRKRGD